jgi:hypothetical protein
MTDKRLKPSPFGIAITDEALPFARPSHHRPKRAIERDG